MSLKTITISAAFLLAGIATATGQDVIEERQQAMKSNGQSMRVLVPMARGQADYDAAAALAEFEKINAVAMEFGDLFPEGSETGGDTKAKDTIWSDRAGFDAAVAKFEADSAAAIAAAPSTLEDFRPVFGAVAENCGACHEVYQIEDD